MLHGVIKFFRGFWYAGKGIVSAYLERNMRFHGIATLVVLAASYYYQLTQQELITVLLLIAAVWSAEMVNTAIEELANITRDELKLSYAATRRARDVAAGAVLIIAIMAAIIGGMIFGPKIF